MKRLIAFAALLCLCTSGLSQTIDLAATWQAVSSNSGGYANCTLALTNIGTTTLTNKIYEFDYDRQITATGPVMLLASQAGSHYTFTNAGYYNGIMAPGAGKVFSGFHVTPSDVGTDAPVNLLVNGLLVANTYLPPTLTGADASAVEGNSGPAPMNFTFTLSRAVADPVSFDYATQSGTAVAGADFLPASGTVTFAPGSTQQVVTVSIIGNFTPQPDRSFTLVLSDPSNCTLARTNITGSILDDDRVPVTYYSAWRATNDISPTAGDMDMLANGRTLFDNYVFNWNPNSAHAGPSFLNSVVTNGSLQLTYPAWRPDVAYHVVTADALNNSWTTNGVSETWDSQLRTASVSAPSDEPVRFLKLNATFMPDTSRFLELYSAIHDPTNGYFSPEGIPYHSIETLICEAPDYGHETTSEAYSYYILLEAMYGRITGDWSHLGTAWTNLETYMIPSHADQPSNSGMNASKPASYAPEWDLPSQYPAALNTSAPVGADPLYNELKTTYDSPDIYGMHWLMDVDNWYGYGQRGDGTSRASFINTFQRGPQESVWETVPQPSWESFKWGGPNGYLDLFTSGGGYSPQWRYTDAPDADARAIQAVYWAKVWADQQGGSPVVDAVVAKAARMGDCLRYALFDKYFRNITNNTVAGTGRQAEHYLLSWYYAWGGSTNTTGAWAWRIGSSHCHFGYQNPMAAWALGNFSPLIPLSPTARQDWTNSARRQIEFYRWLQSDEGGIAGGATSSYDGRYDTPPAGTPTFYGMAYVAHPVYLDPPSNQWFGFQTWSMERVAEYYYVTADPLAKAVLDKWINWVLANVQVTNNTYAIPGTLTWNGQPDTWNAAAPGANANLHVTIADWNQDVGIASSVVRSLLYYAAGTKRWATEHPTARQTATNLLNCIWATTRDSVGVSVAETHSEYTRFFEQQVYTPAGWVGHMPNGDTITNNVTFLGIRSKYLQDPAFPALQAAYTNWVAGGRVGNFNPPAYHFHRFWATVDAALANADYDLLFPQ